jgi:hypothetical protein
VVAEALFALLGAPNLDAVADEPLHHKRGRIIENLVSVVLEIPATKLYNVGRNPHI